jgi:hypothetical protein
VRVLIASLALGASLMVVSCLAAVQSFPADFKTQIIATNGARMLAMAGFGSN